MKRTGLPHPGIILSKEFFEPFGLTQLAVSKATGIPQSRLSEILVGERAISADTAARLGRYFGVDPRNWLSLQTSYDLRLIEQSEAKAPKKINRLAVA